MTAIDWTGAQLPSAVERLANGLTVLVHVEPKSPIAAVFIGYQAGSRYEPPFKAGLAHLCEHLMFTGTRTNPGSYFAPFEQAGASSMNAYIREDYSAYFATVPAAALDFALSMEADRMANIAEAIDDDRLERQREVVVNELRQREGQPYGCAARMLAEMVHPAGHPYAHLPDGLISEIGNVSTENVRAWTESRHSPAMATLVVAGDIDARQVIEKAKRHFGGLANKRPVAWLAFPAKASPAVSRRSIELPVSYGGLCIAWNGPGIRSADYPALEAACEILAGSKRSRLWRRIVQEERLASDVAIEMRPRELGALIVLSVIAQAGVPLDIIEEIVRIEIERLLAQGPGSQELEVARLRLLGKMVRGFERVGGPNSKSDALGLAAIVGGTPDAHRSHLSTLVAINPEAVAGATRSIGGAGAALEMRPISQGKGR
jgi:zinc protease